MSTTSVVRSGGWWRPARITSAGTSLRQASRKVYKTLDSSAVAVAVALSFVGMLGPVPFTYLSSHLFTAQMHTVAKNSGPHIVSSVSAPAAKKCANYDTSMASDFAACPSFALNYGQQSDGPFQDTYLHPFLGPSNTNKELQLYTSNPRNLRVENGSLVLEAHANSSAASPYTSARVDTKLKEDFQYGRLIIRAKMPAGVGTWPAIWMLPSQPKYQQLNASPETHYQTDGEIDIAEAIGTQPNVVYGVAHSLAYDNNGIDHTFFNTVLVNNNDTTFHDYELDWTPTKLTMKVDGNEFFTYVKAPGADYRFWPYDQPFYLIMNLAIGGSWAGQDRADFPENGVDSQALPASLKIQSVNYYSYIGPR